ncbi:Aspergillopepsin-2 [Lachnellula suecica]|uniref:Aspergillopepsin-2 n=1 Tax=Lachnellula suecica TaxID=602035 RepID=A0A8T9BWQ9_9HELO|nr:Aspergillopepsin-2 [Lachnellula suecica]
MKFTIASALALASSASAAALGSHRAPRKGRQTHTGHHSQPMIKSQGPAGIVTNNSEVSYSTNWAGAVLTGTKYTVVTGSFTVPTASTTGSGSAWVGIDGDSCETAILQKGIDWTKSGSSITYDAWYEWYPDYSYNYVHDIEIAAGDTITVTVEATRKSAGTSTITNESTGLTVVHTFTSSAVEADLCEYDAEWIVEDFESESSLVTFKSTKNPP